MARQPAHPPDEFLSLNFIPQFFAIFHNLVFLSYCQYPVLTLGDKKIIVKNHRYRTNIDQ